MNTEQADKISMQGDHAAELRTLRDLLRYAVSRFNETGLFYGHGTDNAYDEAAYLILHTLHLPLDRLEPFLDARLTKQEKAGLLHLIDRRVNERVPVAYLTHEAWLRDFRFYVDERVIVPRSHIAELLEDRLEPWIDDPGSVQNGLDLCTGSGCLAILMAHAFPQAKIDAIDLSQEALEVAKRNVADYGLESRIELVESNLFSAIPGRQYDVIISNPPYVTHESMERLPPEYVHEPALALAAGTDGMDVVRQIMRFAKQHLRPRGLLVVEVGANRAQAEQAFPDMELIWPELEGESDSVFIIHRENFLHP